MKKTLRSFFFAIIAMATATMFTSCDDDQIISYTLEGSWTGYMYAEYEWEGTWYETDYTEVTFNGNPFSTRSGSGTWVDYFKTRWPGEYEYYANHISWRVINGEILIHFYEDNVDTRIRNYSLSYNTFKGEVYASDGSWRSFKLRRDNRDYDYDYNYGWSYFDGGYYARQMRTDSDSIATAPANDMPRPRRVINGNNRSR